MVRSSALIGVALLSPASPKGRIIISRRWNLRIETAIKESFRPWRGDDSTPPGSGPHFPGFLSVGFTYG
jgi:hypothetical protein